MLITCIGWHDYILRHTSILETVEDREEFVCYLIAEENIDSEVTNKNSIN